jgi:hypothetical protein
MCDADHTVAMRHAHTALLTGAPAVCSAMRRAIRVTFVAAVRSSEPPIGGMHGE